MIYETADNRDAQQNLLEEYCQLTGYSFVQVPALEPYDAILFEKGMAVGIAEVKVRGWAMNYGTLDIDCSKIDRMVMLARQRDCRAVLIVKITLHGSFEFRGWISLDDETVSTFGEGIIARTDRRDPDDVDRCYKIPIQSFNGF